MNPRMFARIQQIVAKRRNDDYISSQNFSAVSFSNVLMLYLYVKVLSFCLSVCLSVCNINHIKTTEQLQFKVSMMHAELIEVDSRSVAVFQSFLGKALFLAGRSHRHLRSNFSRTTHWISIKFEMPLDSINGANRLLPETSIVMSRIFVTCTSRF